MAQNNSNKFSGTNLTSTTTVATNTVNNNTTSTTPLTYTPDLHTDDLAFPLFLSNPPGIIIRGGESSNRRYIGWYHKLNTGEYRTGKRPRSNPRQQPTVIKGSSRSNSAVGAYNGTTGYYDYFLEEREKGYIRAKSDQILTFEDQQEILSSGYNGESGAQEPAHINYIMGNMVRYFARKRNTEFYQEINSKQFNDIGTNNSVWDRRSIFWQISDPLQERAIELNKTYVWLVEAGSVPNLDVLTQPDPNNPTAFVNPQKKIFTYTGPTSIWSDGTGKSRLNVNITNLFRDRNTALERGKVNALFLTGVLSPQENGEPWPKFMEWFKGHERAGIGKYDDWYANTSPYLTYINPENPLSGNAFYQSCTWLLSPEDWKVFSKYFVCTPDTGGVRNVNAISSNGNINSGNFYDESYPLYDANNPLKNRVNLKRGSSYALNNSPNSNTRLENGENFYFIYYKLLNSNIWRFYYNLSQPLYTIENKSDQKIYFLGRPTGETSGLRKWVPQFTAFYSNTVYKIFGKDTLSGVEGNFDLQSGGTGYPLFDIRNNYRGYVPSVYTIYQHTGMDKPSNGVDNNSSKYDNFYYKLPKIGTKLFRADGTPVPLKYRGPIFEVYRDCQAAVEFKTTIFSGPKPDLPLTLTASDGRNRPYRITNIPLYNEFYFKNYLLESFPEAVKYFTEVGISLPL